MVTNIFLLLYESNRPLFHFGMLTLFGGLVSGIMIFISDSVILGVSAYLKPFKFFVSIAVFVWTMAYFMTFLENQVAVRTYSIVLVLTLGFELAAILFQAVKGTTSHFNVSSAYNTFIFRMMAAAITVAMLWTGYICYLFFIQKSFILPDGMVWAIRLGMLFTVLFSFQGFVMGAKLSHTVGAPDGSPGLPVTNWSKSYGDLRVSHFFGLHALQFIPLATLLFAGSVLRVFVISGLYFAFVFFTLIQALRGKPFPGF